MAFTVLALGACLLMTRIARDPRDARWATRGLLGLGVLIGLAATDPQRGRATSASLG
jgi:hypothetical protein